MPGDFPAGTRAAGAGARLSAGAATFPRPRSDRTPNLAQHAFEILRAALRTAGSNRFVFLEDQDLKAVIAGQASEFKNGHLDGLSLLFYQ
jgi:hypothetical protein